MEAQDPKPDEEKSPFERFASVTKRLFAVPKKEAEEKALDLKAEKRDAPPHQ